MKPGRLIFAAALTGTAFIVGNRLSEGYQARGGFADTTPAVVIGMLSRDPLRPISANQTDLIVGVLAAIAILFTMLYQAAGHRDTRVGEEHGSAKWGTPADLRPFISRTYAQNLLFTRAQRLSLDGYKTQRNLNALIYGSSGSGKSRYFVMPNLYQANTSFVVTDPKGELYRSTAPFLREQRYQVRTLNLIDLANSDTFNPFQYFSDTQPAVDTLILTENIVANTNGRAPRNAGDFWEKSERALLAALTAYVYFVEGPNCKTNNINCR